MNPTQTTPDGPLSWSLEAFSVPFAFVSTSTQDQGVVLHDGTCAL